MIIYEEVYEGEEKDFYNNFSYNYFDIRNKFWNS